MFFATPAQAHALRRVEGVAWVGAFLPEHASPPVDSVAAAVHVATLHNDLAMAAPASSAQARRGPHAQGAQGDAVPSQTPANGVAPRTLLPASLLVSLAPQPHVATAHAIADAWRVEWPAARFRVLAPHTIKVSVPREHRGAGALPEPVVRVPDLVSSLRQHPRVRWVDAATPVAQPLTKWARWTTQGMELEREPPSAYGSCPAGCEGRSGSCSPACDVAACKFDPQDCHDSAPTSPFTKAGLSGQGTLC